MLLQGMPSQLDLAAIQAELHGVAGVEAIHHLRAGLRWRRLPSGKRQHMSGSGEIGADKGLTINTLVFGVILFAG